MHKVLAVVFVVVLSGCSILASKADDGLPVPTGNPEASCGEPITNVDSLSDRQVVIFGEMHGTIEIPAFAGTVACELAKKGKPITVTLELPTDEQQLLDAYWVSGEVKGLFASEFWTYEYQDGRRSKAMADLITTLRKHREQGLDLRVRYFDPGGPERESKMAKKLLELMRREPDRQFIVLTGNIHARTVIGMPFNEDLIPVAVQLRDEDVDLVSLNVHHTGGQAWVCTGGDADSCGPTTISDNGGTAARTIDLEPIEAYDGSFSVGKLSASPPRSR